MKRKHCSLRYLLTPDYMFRTYDEVTAEFLQSIGIRALLIDIDNTLAPYEQPEPDERIRAWFASLSAAGIRASLISNNHAPRVELFNRTLGLDAYPDSGKPRPKTLRIAMARMGSCAEDTAVLGDQLLTDALAGHHLGLRAIIVPPIKDKTTLFFRFKRWLEKPYIKRYERAHADAPRKDTL
ncbi:MAG: YqeG family HAD IIIA-type phosphatase [Ruminococcaceae bacterium]|nr:YqeG family HAD IIIA-type phosphatase [Oscillospiraceae bacterium]